MQRPRAIQQPRHPLAALVVALCLAAGCAGTHTQCPEPVTAASTPTSAAVAAPEQPAPPAPLAPPAPVDPLPSWNEGPSKRAILAFVAKVTTPGGAEYVAPPARIAVFDNDGTLWAEQPMYFQFAFVLDRVKQLAPQHPEWKKKQPYKAAISGDMKGLLAGGVPALLELALATQSGMTAEEFEPIVRAWIETAKHPTSGLRFVDMVYQPMLELLAYLRAHEFKTFIVSGGGVDFMRAWVEAAYGIPPEQVIGSSGKLTFELRGDAPAVVKQPELAFVDDKEGKPVAIAQHIGRRPIFAAGNSDGDLQMIQWSTAGEGPRLGLYVHHTDAEREFAYDRDSPVGKLDKGLDMAARKGWTVVDMKAEWNRVFPVQTDTSPNGAVPTQPAQ